MHQGHARSCRTRQHCASTEPRGAPESTNRPSACPTHMERKRAVPGGNSKAVTGRSSVVRVCHRCTAIVPIPRPERPKPSPDDRGLQCRIAMRTRPRSSPFGYISPRFLAAAPGSDGGRKARLGVGRTLSQTMRWRTRAVAAVAMAGAMVGILAIPATEAAGATSSLPTAYVTNAQLSSLSVFVGAKFAASIADVGRGPTGIAIDPSTDTAYVADYGFFGHPARTVTPVDLSTSMPGAPIVVGNGPLAIALIPGGGDAVVTLQGTASSPGHQVREIDLTNGAVSAPVEVGKNPESLAINPAGTMAYVAAFGSAEITPVDLTTWPPKAETPIPLPGTAPRAIAVAPDGKRAYVLDAENASVIPISLTTDHVGTAVSLVCHAPGDPGCTPDAITISPDGSTAYVAAAGSGDVLLLSLPALAVAGVVQTGGYPDALGMTGKWLYVANGASNSMSVFFALKPRISDGGVTYPFGVAVTPGTEGPTGTTDPTVVHASPPAHSASGPARTVLTHELPFYGLPAPGN